MLRLLLYTSGMKCWTTSSCYFQICQNNSGPFCKRC